MNGTNATPPGPLRRQAYADVLATGKNLVDVLKRRGPAKPVEMSNALMCASIDSIGSFGFQHGFGCVESMRVSDRNYLVDVGPLPVPPNMWCTGTVVEFLYDIIIIIISRYSPWGPHRP
jgi:hypothetical protein